MRLLALILIFALSSPSTFAQSNSLKSPNVSANALFLYRNSNFHRDNADTVRNGIDIQEAELALYSDVDPYSRFFMVLSTQPQYNLQPSGKVEETWSIAPEELYAESDYVPGVTFRAGKFKAAFGKHNQLHTHAYPFVDAPLANTVLLGDEGLNDVGISAAGLLPVPWFSEVTLQYLRGEGDNAEFSSPTPGDGVMLGRWKNLLDLNDAMTIEAGASYARGNNSVGGVTTLTGGDLTWKWRPTVGGKYHSAIAALEYIGRDLEQAGARTEHGNGFTGWGLYQFAERWSALGRYENLYLRNSLTLPNILTTKTSVSTIFAASEFSSFRLEYDLAHGPTNLHGERNEQQIYVQANFTIGAHPSHAY